MRKDDYTAVNSPVQRKGLFKRSKLLLVHKGQGFNAQISALGCEGYLLVRKQTKRLVFIQSLQLDLTFVCFSEETEIFKPFKNGFSFILLAVFLKVGKVADIFANVPSLGLALCRAFFFFPLNKLQTI